MPLIIPSNSISAGGYEVDNSLRFNDGSSDYLSRTPSASNRKTYTISTWIKRGELSSVQNIFTAGVSGRDGGLRWLGDNKLSFYQWDGSSSYDFSLETNAMYRDVSAWYHIVVAVDTTQGTASNRLKLYVNGEQITSLQSSSYPSLNFDTLINNNNAHYISGAVDTTYGTRRFDGYMSEVCFIDGTALDPTSFGEFDSGSGIWKPIDVSGLTFGTNGFYLDFEDSAALGDDVSGNGNDFTVNNLTAIDQTTDTPTNNFCTLNPLDVAPNQTFTEGNLAVLWSALNKSNRANFAVDTGKWYWEVKVTSVSGGSGNGVFIGISNSSHDLGTWIGANANSWGYYASNGKIYTNNNGGTTYGNSYTLNDIINIAYDATNGKLYFGKNGTWQNSGDPVTATNPAYSSLSGLIFPSSSAYTDNSLQFNFGNPPFTISSGNTDGNGYGNFEYAVPSGYLSLCTANLSEVLG
jgi:hypothetical protein